MNVSKLKIARVVAGLTQAELAKKVGVSASLITHIERRKACPSLGTLSRISRVLNVSLDELAQDIIHEDTAC